MDIGQCKETIDSSVLSSYSQIIENTFVFFLFVPNTRNAVRYAKGMLAEEEVLLVFWSGTGNVWGLDRWQRVEGSDGITNKNSSTPIVCGHVQHTHVESLVITLANMAVRCLEAE